MAIRQLNGKTITIFTSPIIKENDSKWAYFKKQGVSLIINCMDNVGLAYKPTPIPYRNANVIETADDWGYLPFYQAMAAVLEIAPKKNQKVVFHCKAGICRSVTIASVIMLAMDTLTDTNCLKKLNYNMGKGRIPKDIIKFLKLQIQNPSFSAGKLRNMVMKNA